ncbi:DUF3108 domain-containing protein [endosymbiont of unidentified scaly snail isolate Monju]|uniref:DUF3108 domain-containing protein n=1 Tax=endosymbiont of unidentified scaly snail isolate Monju TaxID=1248727 RepID=UPI0003891CA1|nr:DUF3108 domain-containing protein [endosymbiont of unidentified scaly snail isolate Monju]BAN68574.1 hypothetical protein EBS_0613 [endosymbiont of unidentified scaly snail isolate Monju]
MASRPAGSALACRRSCSIAARACAGSPRLPSPDAPYLESELFASSAPYGAVEAFYAIRYRFRSWYWRDRSGVLAAEYHEFGRPDDLEHKLIYLDDPEKPFIARNLLHEGELDLPRLRTGAYAARVAVGERHAFDRLGLLQAVRSRALRPGEVFEARVSNGSRMLNYRVKVEKVTRVHVAGSEREALKLRFDGIEYDRRGRAKATHRPVYIWVSTDARHIPLLAEARAAVGRFRVELQPSSPRSELALRSG